MGDYTMRLFNLTLLAFFLVPLSSEAADLKLVTKAPAALFDVTGIYAGVGVLGETTKASGTIPTLGTTGDITTAGAAVGGIVGYHKGTAASFWQAEAFAYYKNLGGVQSVTGTDINDRVSFGGRLKVGGTQSYANVLALLGNLGGGVLIPTGPVTGQPTMPYAYVGVDVSKPDMTVLGIAASSSYVPKFELGVGMVVKMTNQAGVPTGCAMDNSVGYSPASKSQDLTNGLGSVSEGRSFKMRAAVLC